MGSELEAAISRSYLHLECKYIKYSITYSSEPDMTGSMVASGPFRFREGRRCETLFDKSHDLNRSLWRVQSETTGIVLPRIPPLREFPPP